MKAAIVYDSGTHTTKKMKSWADVFVAYFQRGIKRNIVPRLGIEIEHFIALARRLLPLRWEMNGGRLSGFDARSIYKTT